MDERKMGGKEVGKGGNRGGEGRKREEKGKKKGSKIGGRTKIDQKRSFHGVFFSFFLP